MEEKSNNYVSKIREAPIIIVERRIGVMLSKSDLERLKKVNIQDEKIEDLPDISVLPADMDEFLYNRAKLYFEYVKNPYLFRVGDVGVKVNFIGEKSFYDAIKDMVVDINEH